MKKAYGNTGGLKASQLRRLENLYRRRIPPQFVITSELARDLSQLSVEIRRQIGLLIDRQGKIVMVIVGDHRQIVIPEPTEFRAAPGRLRGIRCVHTHLKDEPLTRDDLTDLAFLRLDLIAAITIGPGGRPHKVHVGHLMPNPEKHSPYQLLPPLTHFELDIGCADLIRFLEDEFALSRPLVAAQSGKERALLVSVTTASRSEAQESMEELKELALSGGVEVVGTLLQQREKADSRFLMGRGKLEELIVTSLQLGASLIIFDQEMNPSQARSITNHIDLKVIDRTQLILDIFAQRAQTREGKLQVELAQLKYLLPRLVTKNTAMSRLTGGIGGRGPGETKLEINRRRVRERLARLETALQSVKKRRKQQRSQRNKKGLPIISIVGYTNAGKSTLLNTLTKSRVHTENRLFATLDPSSRRLRIPVDREVIITDTVGFIRNLPQDLMVAFRATLEELKNADLLLHVIDISNPRHQEQIGSVERILTDLQIDHIPMLRVLNKSDLITKEKAESLSRTLGAISVSAIHSASLKKLIGLMAEQIQKI